MLYSCFLIVLINMCNGYQNVPYERLKYSKLINNGHYNIIHD